MKNIAVLVIILYMAVTVDCLAQSNPAKPGELERSGEAKPITLVKEDQAFTFAPDADFSVTGMVLSKDHVRSGEDIDLEVRHKYTGGAATYPSFLILVSLNGQTLKSFRFGDSSFGKACGPGYNCTGTIVFGAGAGSDDFNRDFYALVKEGLMKSKLYLMPRI